MTKHIFFTAFLLTALQSLAGLDKQRYFSVFSCNTATKITAERIRLEKMTATSEIRAYLGAMRMKEAQFQSTTKAKLDYFNKGKAELEAEIAAHRNTVEFRFLRLMIQENCPRILRYNGNVEEDAALIEKGFAGLSDTLKNIVRSYARSSAALPASKLASR